MTKRYELCILRGGISNGHLVAELSGIRFRVEDYPSFARALERLFSFRAFGLVQPSRIAALDPAVLETRSNERDTSLGGVELKDSYASLRVNWESYLKCKDMALFPLMRRVVVNLRPVRYEWLVQNDMTFYSWAEIQVAHTIHAPIDHSSFSDKLSNETRTMVLEWVKSMSKPSERGGKDAAE